MSGVVASGHPFTPMVAGDINGDGASNDRAFVVSPSGATPVASAMRTLFDQLPGRVEGCLTRQVNQIASANSCRGPWRAMMNARADFFGRVPRLSRNASLSLNFANPLTGIDLLLHGANDLRGWGGAAFPDPTLYHVRGFDAASQTYIYEVNPRFGQSRPASTAITNAFRITLDVTLDLRGNANAKMAQMIVRPPHGSNAPRASADTIYKRILGGGTLDWVSGVLRMSDSLLLNESAVGAPHHERARSRPG